MIQRFCWIMKVIIKTDDILDRHNTVQFRLNNFLDQKTSNTSLPANLLVDVTRSIGMGVDEDHDLPRQLQLGVQICQVQMVTQGQESLITGHVIE